MMTEENVPACEVCRDIPERMMVETLHTPDRLPAAVERLTVIGGAGTYGCEQLRKCPACGAYFSYINDHDSEAGLGYGYTDEAVRRLSRDEARELASQAAQSARASIRYWESEATSYGEAAARYAAKAKLDLQQLEAEVRRLAEGQ